MITLITGSPGAGKSLYLVDMILSQECKTERPIYVDGVPGLTLRHELADDIHKWPEWAPNGSLIVIDEVQREHIWPKASSASKVPESIKALETHRHRGFDFVLLTQGPHLVNHNLRALVGRHIHLRRTAMGVYLYEWPECCGDPSTGWKTAPVKIRWSHPKKSFGLYKSASEHTKVKHRLPPAVYVFGFSVVAMIAGSAYMYQSVRSKFQPAPIAQAQPGHAQQAVAPGVSGAPAFIQPDQIDGLTPLSFFPKFQDLPASAPAYEGMQKVVAAPRVSACVQSKTRCICYSQQMTRLDVTPRFCNEWVAGRYFDPFKPDAMPEGQGMPHQQVNQPPAQAQQAQPLEQPPQQT